MLERLNFDAYQMIRMDEAPDDPGSRCNAGSRRAGWARPGPLGAVPAIANAIFAAAGKSPAQRRQPVDADAPKQPV